jgi:hypothetical protein
VCEGTSQVTGTAVPSGKGGRKSALAVVKRWASVTYPGVELDSRITSSFGRTASAVVVRDDGSAAGTATPHPCQDRVSENRMEPMRLTTHEAANVRICR